MRTYVILFTICAAFMVTDILTGLVRSMMTGQFRSSKMRLGMWHKLGEIAALILCAEVEIAARFVTLPVAELFVFKAIATYIIIMEIGSIWENIKKIAPDFQKYGGK